MLFYNDTVSSDDGRNLFERGGAFDAEHEGRSKHGRMDKDQVTRHDDPAVAKDTVCHCHRPITDMVAPANTVSVTKLPLLLLMVFLSTIM